MPLRLALFLLQGRHQHVNIIIPVHQPVLVRVPEPLPIGQGIAYLIHPLYTEPLRAQKVIDGVQSTQ